MITSSPSWTPWYLRRTVGSAAVTGMRARTAAQRLHQALRGPSDPAAEAPHEVDDVGQRPPAEDEPLTSGPLAHPGECLQRAGGPVLNVVAHPDDDLIFMSPDLLDRLAQGHGVVTVCVTSGDAGCGMVYARAREEGLRRAYAAMLGVANAWDTRTLHVARRRLTLQVLRSPSLAALLFLRVPDGGMWARPQDASVHLGLERLLRGELADVPVMGSRARFSRDDLVDVLVGLMAGLEPADVCSLDHRGAFDDGDHSDHHAVGRLAHLASQQYLRPHRFTAYLGYTSATSPPNLTPGQLAAKLAALQKYSRGDVHFRFDTHNAAWAQRQYVSAREDHPRASGLRADPVVAPRQAQAERFARPPSLPAGRPAADRERR